MQQTNDSITNWINSSYSGFLWTANFLNDPKNRIFVLALAFVLFLFILFLQCVLRQPGLDKRTLFFALFEDDIRGVFRRQERHTMDTIKTGVNSILHQHPERPTVLLLLASQEAYNTALRLARAVSSTVVFCINGCWYPESDIWTLSGRAFTAMETFWDFHAELSRCMARYNVVIITDLHRLHPQVALVLLSLMDDTYSPLPQSLVIVVVNILDRFSDVELRSTLPVILAERFLREQWENSIDRHMLTRLLNVLTGRAAIVNAEA